MSPRQHPRALALDGNQGPLRSYLPAVLGVPTLRRRPGVARSTDDAGLALLRRGGEWRASDILKRLGPADRDAQYLPRLLIACAVLQGPQRIRDMVERLLGVLKGAEPRVIGLAQDPAIVRARAPLRALVSALAAAKKALPEVRARALNEIAERPDGLRLQELRALAEHAESVVLAHELSNKQNLSGVEFARSIAARVPAERDAAAWLARALGAPIGPELLLYTPPEYRRVVVVYADGLLAYDPKR